MITIDASISILLPQDCVAESYCLEDEALLLRTDLADSSPRYGLWSLARQQLLVPAEYDDVQTSFLSDYLWCRRGEDWFFVSAATGTKLRMHNAVALLEEQHFRCLLRTFDNSDDLRMACIDDYGGENPDLLRQLALRQHSLGGKAGHIQLFNATLGLEVVANVYGHVLFTNLNSIII